MLKENMKAEGAGKLAKYGMWACCIVMLIPVGAYLLAGGGSGGSLQTILAFAPLALCFGMHLVMHKMMGRSCHGHSENASRNVAPKEPFIENSPSAKVISAVAE